MAGKLSGRSQITIVWHASAVLFVQKALSLKWRRTLWNSRDGFLKINFEAFVRSLSDETICANGLLNTPQNYNYYSRTSIEAVLFVFASTYIL